MYLRHFSLKVHHIQEEQAFCVPEDGIFSITPNQVLLCLKKPSKKRV